METAGEVVVVATVGTGRDRRDIAKAIAFSIDRHKAERAVFLCSGKTRDETVPCILEILGWPSDRYRVDVCANEDDVQDLFVEWNQRWDDWFGRWPDAEAVVDFTTGTKPMSAAAVLLALARNARAVSYVVGERDTTGRVTRSTDVRSISPNQVVAHRELRRAVEHFHAGNYAAARDIAAPYRKIDCVSDEQLRAIALSVHSIADAYEAWDRFDYKAAAHALRQSERNWTRWTWVEDTSRLKGNKALVKDICENSKPNQPTPALAADLLANADRCMKRSDWDDAVARLYRACEMLAQLRLWHTHKQKTGDVDPSRLPESIRAAYTDRKGHAEDGKCKVGLFEAYELLERLGDDLGTEFVKRYRVGDKPGELKNLLGVRNNSLLAHGTAPISGKNAQRLWTQLKELAAVADPAILNEWFPKCALIRFKNF